MNFNGSTGSVGVSATHLHCHSHLQDKVVLFARVRPRKRRPFHTGRSSTHHWDRGSPGLQRQCKVGQQWAGGEKKDRRILNRHLVCFLLYSKHLINLSRNLFMQLKEIFRILQLSWYNTPGVSAFQLILQPIFEVSALVLNNISTILLVLVMLVGSVEPQLLSSKVSPSPSVIVR